MFDFRTQTQTHTQRHARKINAKGAIRFTRGLISQNAHIRYKPCVIDGCRDSVRAKLLEQLENTSIVLWGYIVDNIRYDPFRAQLGGNLDPHKDKGSTGIDVGSYLNYPI